ncbi:MAG: GumC family protein [Ignavibacteria bacterium]
MTNNEQQAVKKTGDQLPTNNLKEYIGIIRNNILPIVLIFIASIMVTLVYVTNAIDVYKTVTTLKITKPQGSILTTSLMPEAESFSSDRFISNEIEILKSNSIREKIAASLLDSFKVINDRNKFYYVVNKQPELKDNVISLKGLTLLLSTLVSINQKRGLDIVEIEVQSPSNYEAALIANVYGNIYQRISLDYSRRELTTIREFLGLEKDKRFKDLATSEGAIQDYQQKGGILFLDDQAKKVVDEISTYQAQKNATEVDLFSKQKASNEIRSELAKVDRSVLEYIDGQMNESYFTELQKKIAELEVQRDVETAVLSDEKLKEKVNKEYQKKIDPLKKNRDDKMSIVKTGILSNTPQEKSQLGQKLFEVDIEIITNKAKLNSINKVIAKNETLFNKLPAQSIELARLERDRKSNEKLYLTLEEKYQEAIVNERAKLGNVNVIDEAMLPLRPSKPNRQLIVAIGAILGLALGVGFAFLRNYLDRSIKTPEEIEARGISVLSWIPSIEELKELGSSQLEFIVANKPNATASESFKALRTRVNYSKLESELKTILITSSLPSEGKTTVALNLAGSFAFADKKVLLLDCDLRKPRVHSIFQAERYPGLSDYLFSNVKFEEIVRKTKLEKLDFITSGTIPPNPSELLGSKQMLDFLKYLETQYDIIVLDSPPYISVTDAEILSRISDGTILVVQANKTPYDAFVRAHDRIVENEEHKFLGAVLNNFSIKSAYGYYYNYYYYYSKPNGTNKKRVKSQIKTK